MPLDRVKVAQTGSAVVGNATTTFYFSTATPANLTALGVFFAAIKAYFATTSTYVIPSSGDTISDTTGQLTGAWTAAAPTPVVGTGVSIPSILSGLLIAWKANSIIDGHRPTGKTIIVPASNGAMLTTGMVAPAAITAINSAAATFLATTVGFQIWHRPVYDQLSHPAALVRPGASIGIGSGTCSSKPTVLRSRRD